MASNLRSQLRRRPLHDGIGNTLVSMGGNKPKPMRRRTPVPKKYSVTPCRQYEGIADTIVQWSTRRDRPKVEAQSTSSEVHTVIPEIKSELRNGILVITIARPDKKNALTNDMYRVLADRIERAGANQGVRVVLIQADGDLFTAGNDLAEFAEQATGRGPQEPQVIRLLKVLASTTVPIVAAVQGKAVGVGTTMLLHCDYVLLGEDAQLITPFLNLALVPEAASSLLLPLRIGHVRAFEMFSLGEPVDARNAVAWGLANKIVPVSELRAEAARVAARIATKPMGSLTATKRLMRESARILAQIDSESVVFSERLKSAEAREAFTAFAQKRQPDFSKVG